MILEFYLIICKSGDVTTRKRRPSILSSGQIVVPMRIEVPDEWFNPEADRVTLRLAGPVRDGLFVAADQPFVPDGPFTLGDSSEGHAVGDHDCNAGWCGGDNGYPKPCPCGGLIHAEFGDYEDSSGFWLWTKCDACGRTVHEVE